MNTTEHEDLPGRETSDSLPLPGAAERSHR